MDGDDPARRRRLLPLTGPRAPAVATDLSSSSASLRRLPPVHPSAAAPRFAPGFAHYQPQPGGAGGSHHTRALSQPQFMSMDFLFRPPYADLAAQAPIARSPSPPAPPPGFEKGPSGLPPLHRRSQSDVLLAVSTGQPNLPMPPPAPVTAEALAAANNSTLDGILGAYMGPKGLVTVASSGPGAAQERRDQQNSQAQVRAWSPADSSENEADSGDGSLSRHSRSLSADSVVGKLAVGAMGNLPPPSPGPGAAAGLARSGSGSIGGAAALFAKEFALAGFSEADKKKIMENEHLAKIVLTDPKKVKRILNNRLSAAKSKERKMKYVTDLERKVQVLQSEKATLTSQVEMLQRGHSLLSTHNNEIKIRLHAMEQQAQLRNALNEALTSEVQRLKLVAGETSDHQTPNGSDQQMSSRMIQLHQLLKKPPKA